MAAQRMNAMTVGSAVGRLRTAREHPAAYRICPLSWAFADRDGFTIHYMAALARPVKREKGDSQAFWPAL